jgi:hypothetical protein
MQGLGFWVEAGPLTLLGALAPIEPDPGVAGEAQPLEGEGVAILGDAPSRSLLETERYQRLREEQKRLGDRDGGVKPASLYPGNADPNSVPVNDAHPDRHSDPGGSRGTGPTHSESHVGNVTTEESLKVCCVSSCVAWHGVASPAGNPDARALARAASLPDCGVRRPQATARVRSMPALKRTSANFVLWFGRAHKLFMLYTPRGPFIETTVGRPRLVRMSEEPDDVQVFVPVVHFAAFKKCNPLQTIVVGQLNAAVKKLASVHFIDGRMRTEAELKAQIKAYYDSNDYKLVVALARGLGSIWTSPSAMLSPEALNAAAAAKAAAKAAATDKAAATGKAAAAGKAAGKVAAAGKAAGKVAAAAEAAATGKVAGKAAATGEAAAEPDAQDDRRTEIVTVQYAAELFQEMTTKDSVAEVWQRLLAERTDNIFQGQLQALVRCPSVPSQCSRPGRWRRRAQGPPLLTGLRRCCRMQVELAALHIGDSEAPYKHDLQIGTLRELTDADRANNCFDSLTDNQQVRRSPMHECTPPLRNKRAWGAGVRRS